MLKQIVRYILPERIEGEEHALSTSKLCSRNEVSVTRYENDHVRLSFQRNGRYVEPYAHIDAFLSQRWAEVIVCQTVDGQATIQQPFL